MNDELNGLVQELATALIDGAEELKTLDTFAPEELLRLSESLLALSQATKYLAEVAQLLNR